MMVMGQSRQAAATTIIRRQLHRTIANIIMHTRQHGLQKIFLIHGQTPFYVVVWPRLLNYINNNPHHN
jgi:hypothetical protein